jgi:GT2 family glycosyltransferase
MDISIIIVNYNSARLAVDCIDSIKKYTEGVSFEVIVVDNDSQDDSESLLKTAHPDAQWVQTGYNAGFARANNKGFDNAKGKYLLLLNADTLLFDNVLQKSFDRMESDISIAAIGGLQLNVDKSPMPYYRNSALIRRTFYILPQKQLINNLLNKWIPEPVYEDQNQTDMLVGAFMFVRKSVVEKVGRLDESFFMYGEDNEWSGRLRKVGKLCYYPDIQFIHLENQTAFRRTKISWVNRFSTQMQVSNLLWIRKEKGIGAYLLLIFHYVSLVIIFVSWKVLVNILKLRNPFFQFENQKIFALKTGVLLKFFWKTVFNKKGFYKIAPEDNIDKIFNEKN